MGIFGFPIAFVMVHLKAQEASHFAGDIRLLSLTVKRSRWRNSSLAIFLLILPLCLSLSLCSQININIDFISFPLKWVLKTNYNQYIKKYIGKKKKKKLKIKDLKF